MKTIKVSKKESKWSSMMSRQAYIFNEYEVETSEEYYKVSKSANGFSNFSEEGLKYEYVDKVEIINLERITYINKYTVPHSLLNTLDALSLEDSVIFSLYSNSSIGNNEKKYMDLIQKSILYHFNKDRWDFMRNVAELTYNETGVDIEEYILISFIDGHYIEETLLQDTAPVTELFSDCSQKYYKNFIYKWNVGYGLKIRYEELLDYIRPTLTEEEYEELYLDLMI